MGETVLAREARSNRALIDNRGIVQSELREVTGRAQILKVDAVLTSHERLGTRSGVRARERTLTSVLVMEREDAMQLGVVKRIAKATEAVAVEEDAVIVARNDERHAHLRVILEQLFVPPLHVPLVSLMLPETVESLAVIDIVEDLAHRPATIGDVASVSRGLHTLVRRERLAAALLVTCQDVTGGIGEPHLARRPQHTGSETTGAQAHSVAVLADRERNSLRIAVHHNKALPVMKLTVSRGRHADNLVAHHLKTDEPRCRSTRVSHAHTNHHSLLNAFVARAGRHEASHQRCHEAPHRKRINDRFLIHLINDLG